jgi:hypothetical protein
MMGNSASRFQRPGIQNPDRIFYNDIRKSAYSILPTLCNRFKGSKRQTELNLCAPSVVSHKYVPKFMWDILVQLSSIQVSGRWLLATGLWQLVSCYWSLAACLWIGQQQEA